MFKKSLVAIAVASAALSGAAFAATDSAAGGEYVEKLNEFIDGASLSTVAVTDTRYRHRKGPGVTEWTENLNYTDYNVIVGFNSGYAADTVGVDLAGYLSGSFYNNGACAEISQCDGWGQDKGENGTLKMTTAALKFKFGEGNFRLGMLQSHGIGTVGNVWSFVPGTYRGATYTHGFGNWTLGLVGFDQHTPSWYTTINKDAGQGYHSAFDFLTSIGLNGKFSDAFSGAFGVGYADLSRSDEDNTSFKVGLDYAGNGFSLGYDFYGINSDVNYDGLGAYHGVKFAMPFDSFTWNSEVQYVHSDNGVSVAPRTVAAYGSNNGTFSLWWDALSDWDADGQLSWYNKASFTFGNGWFAYVGGAMSTISGGEGKGGDWRDGGNTIDFEWAINGTIGYSVPVGPLKGSTIRFHTTHLDRSFEEAVDNVQRQDFRFQIIVPYNWL